MVTDVAAGSMNHSLVISHVCKTWRSRRGAVEALVDINLPIDPTEFICILGPSGCGKSTLLEIIAGLVTSTSGQVLHNGRPITGPGPDRGMVFQQAALFPWRSALGNVEFGLQATGWPRAERRVRAMELLQMVGLGDFAHSLPRELSGGMAQRVAVARALANSPDVLLMDEPFGALDAQTRETLQQEMIRVWRQTRATIVFVTHSVQEAVFLADRVVVFTKRPGRIHKVVPIGLPHPRDVTSAEFGDRMRELYLLLRSDSTGTEGAPVPCRTTAET